MTPQQAVLLLGTITLAGCGAGLILIHDTNPLLKGLNWMGTALVVGGTGTAFRLAAATYPVLSPVADLCLLLALMCCYRADRYLFGLDAKLGIPSSLLICLQGLLMVAQWTSLAGPRIAIIAISLLVSLQVSLTADLVRRDASGKSRLAALFTVGLMALLVAGSVLWGVCAVIGLLPSSPWAAAINLLSYSFCIAMAVTLAFFFFWRTTARLSMDLEHMASTDPLTRVFNRRVFMSWCESEQLRSRRMHAPFSLLMLDFDHFKQVNDTFGHHVGDQVLCAAVERIQDSIRGIDVLCRWGGEEFAVLLPNASEEATLIVAERVRRNIRLLESADPRFSDATFTDLQLSASIGTATYEGDEDTYQLMLQRADAALYQAKRAGRNRVIRSGRGRETVEFGSAPVALKA